MSLVFAWLNDALKTNVKFVQGSWDNLYHRFSRSEIPEVDVMINTIYTNHQCDPLQFLTYICDRARKGVFLWVLMSDSSKCVIEYPSGPPHEIFDTERSFPLYFNNDVRISRSLLNMMMNRLGFEIMEIHPNIPGEKWGYFFDDFKMFYAKRIKNIKSAYYSEKKESQIDKIKRRLFSL